MSNGQFLGKMTNYPFTAGPASTSAVIVWMTAGFIVWDSSGKPRFVEETLGDTKTPSSLREYNACCCGDFGKICILLI